MNAHPPASFTTLLLIYVDIALEINLLLHQAVGSVVLDILVKSRSSGKCAVVDNIRRIVIVITAAKVGGITTYFATQTRVIFSD